MNKLIIKTKYFNFLLFGLLFFTSTAIYANDDDDFFALPSPNEILIESENNGIFVKITKDNSSIIKTNLKSSAEKDKIQAAFQMGRIFSIAGFGFKQLNNKVILSLAAKIYKGMSAMELPENINVQIMGYYQKMIMNPKWERSDLMISFTQARSSLLFLLKDPTKVNAIERPVVQSYATSLEMGLWYQSMSLALEVMTNEQLESFTDIYIDEDVFIYFKKHITNFEKNKKHEIFTQMKVINKVCYDLSQKDEITLNDINSLKQKLAEVIK